MIFWNMGARVAQPCVHALQRVFLVTVALGISCASLARADLYAGALDSACAVNDVGKLTCWRWNHYGTVGDGTFGGDPLVDCTSDCDRMIRFQPTLVLSITPGSVKEVTCGLAHCCVLLENSEYEVMCWGIHIFGALGPNTPTNFDNSNNQPAPVGVTGFTSAVTTIAAGHNFVCAALQDGGAVCWGANNRGQLGDGTTTTTNQLVTVGFLTDKVKELGCGGSQGHCCALLESGSLKCWGANNAGSLGDGTVVDRPTPVTVYGITGAIKSLGIGHEHSCVLLEIGEVMCWGNNAAGQVGNGGTTHRLTPMTVPGISNATSVNCGQFHTCVSLQDGTVKCWGSGRYGQIGEVITDEGYRSTPEMVPGISTATRVFAGVLHSCALLSDRSMLCFGKNYFAQLGNGVWGHPESIADPQVVGSPPLLLPSAWNLRSIFGSQVQLYAGGHLHACAVTDVGVLVCWGENTQGQVGDGTIEGDPGITGNARRLNPTPVVGIAPNFVMQVEAGGYHTCVLLKTNDVLCWGANWEGQVGNGGTTATGTPTKVMGFSDTVTSICAGYQYSCAALQGGGVQCWGSKNPHVVMYGVSPVTVPGLENDVVQQLACGGDLDLHTCALLDTGEVKCWGTNSRGELGDGTTVPKSHTDPVVIFDSSGVVESLALGSGSGSHYSCALLKNHEVMCWGQNDKGQLGLGDTNDRYVPTPVTALSGVQSVSCGLHHCCASLDDGTVQCWGGGGDAYFGQLGNGATTQSTIPVAVTGIASAVHVFLGTEHSCASLTDGTMKCWGHNTFGGLGDGTYTADPEAQPVPQAVGGSTPLVLRFQYDLDSFLSHAYQPTCGALYNSSTDGARAYALPEREFTATGVYYARVEVTYYVPSETTTLFIWGGSSGTSSSCGGLRGALSSGGLMFMDAQCNGPIGDQNSKWVETSGYWLTENARYVFEFYYDSQTFLARMWKTCVEFCGVDETLGVTTETTPVGGTVPSSGSGESKLILERGPLSVGYDTHAGAKDFTGTLYSAAFFDCAPPPTCTCCEANRLKYGFSAGRECEVREESWVV